MKICPKCKQSKSLDNFWKDKTQSDGLSTYCIPCKKQRMDSYYSDPVKLESHRKNIRKWMDKNHESKQSYHKTYNQKKRSTPEGRLRANLSSYLCMCLKSSLEYGFGKNTLDVIGLNNWDEFKTHIESQWVDNMSWDNWGVGKDNLTWHIDHIKPVSSANTLDEIKQLFHYSNLRPMWGSDNIRKRNRILN